MSGERGMKVNMSKTKVLISLGQKMIEEHGERTCGVCGKEVGNNSIQCTMCKK